MSLPARVIGLAPIPAAERRTLTKVNAPEDPESGGLPSAKPQHH